MCHCIPLSVAISVLYAVKKRTSCVNTTSVLLFVTYYQRLNRLLVFYIKFDIGVLYKNSFSIHIFRENAQSDIEHYLRRTWISTGNIHISFPIWVKFGTDNLHVMQSNSMNFVKTDVVKGAQWVSIEGKVVSTQWNVLSTHTLFY